MEQLARRLPITKQISTPDRINIATGEPHKYNAARITKFGSAVKSKGKKKEVAVTDTKEVPLFSPSTSSLLVTEEPTKGEKADRGSIEEIDKIGLAEASSTMTTSNVPLSSKRKHEDREKDTKDTKKRKTHERSRGRSRSRGPSKSHRKRSKRYDTTDSSSDSSSDVSSNSEEMDSNSGIDSEEERRLKKRAKSRSRGQSRGRGRARSRSRARYSDSESEDDSDTESSILEPIFMTFTVPNGDAHMRQFNPAISFPKLLEKAYALANINQEIPINLSYEFNGLRLQLKDAEDLRALMDAAILKDLLVNIKVEKVTPIATVTAASSLPIASTPVKKSKQTVKRGGGVKKAVEAGDVDGDSSDEVPLSAIKVSQSKKQSNGNSIVSLDDEDNVPLARIVITEDGSKGATANQGQAETVSSNVAIPMASTPLKSDNIKKKEKDEKIVKKKRRTPEEIERDRVLKEEEKKRKETEKAAQKEEKKAKRRAAERVKREEAKKVEEEKKLKEEDDLKKAKKEEEEAKAKAEADAKAKAEEEERKAKAKAEKKSKSKAKVNKIDESKSVNMKDSEDLKGEKITTEPTASSSSKESSNISPADGGKKKKVSRSKESETIEKAKSSPTKVNGSDKNALASNDEDSKKKKKITSATPLSTSPSGQLCAICFDNTHNKLQCPIIDAGRESVEKRYLGLKEKARHKTKPEREAFKLLQGWLKMSKFNESEEQQQSQQNELLLFRQRNPDNPLSRKLLEAERLEDLQEQQESYAALEREMQKLRNQKYGVKKSSIPSPAAIEEVRDIIDKVNKDRSKMGLPPAHTIASPNKNARSDRDKSASISPSMAIETSSEVDQLQSSPNPVSVTASQSNGKSKEFASPTSSESELATSPMLMADGKLPDQSTADDANSGIEEMILPQREKEVASDHSSDTSDDSDEASEGDSEIIHKGDPTLKEASVSTSSGHESEEKEGEEGEEEEEEEDEIEATQPIPTDEGKIGWISSLLGGFRSTQEQTPAIVPASTPPSAQRQPSSTVEKDIDAALTSSNRPRLAGVPRLSQLYNSKTHSPFVQKGTPQSSPAINNNGESPSKRKVDRSFESDSEEDQSDGSDSDNATSLPSAKRAGKQLKKKPRKSFLSQLQPV